MGYRTPNIDRLAKEGMMFTDSYGEQSCTAGRSSFAGRFAETFKLFPPRQKAVSFTIDDALAKMGEAVGGGGH